MNFAASDHRGVQLREKEVYNKSLKTGGLWGGGEYLSVSFSIFGMGRISWADKIRRQEGTRHTQSHL